MTGYGVTGFKNVKALMASPPIEALGDPAFRVDVMVWLEHGPPLAEMSDEELTIQWLKKNEHLQALAPRRIPDLYSLACEDQKLANNQANYTITSGLACKTLPLQRERWLEGPRGVRRGGPAGREAIDDILNDLDLEMPSTKRQRLTR
jgi:hypothetical protein